MNLRVAKIIKWFFENLVTMMIVVAGIGFLTLMGWEAFLVVGMTILVTAVSGLVVMGCIKLYDKADRTVREIEEGDDPRNRHHLDYYGKNEYEDEYH